MSVMQEMQEKHEKCRVTNNGSTVTVTLRPEEVTQALQDKLTPDDIKNGMAMVDDVMYMASLRNSLYMQCSGTSCSHKCKSLFKSIPNGNQHASIMLLNKMPTEYESCRMCSHCDSTSIFLSLILSRISMTRDDVYCTDMIKCNCEDLDEESFRSCVDNYLMKEVAYVKPKVILCNGIAVMKTWDKLGYIEGLPENVTYGTIYDVVISGISLKIMAIFDLDKVLQKQGDDLSECKGKLWLQILSAYNAIGGK